jgi:hypothetical protein
MHFTPTTAWHETGLRLHLSPARDPYDFSATRDERALALEVHNLNPEVTTTHVFTKSELRRVALWLLWRSIVGAATDN